MKLSSIVLIVIGLAVGFVLGWNWNAHVVQSTIDRAMQFKSANDRLADQIRQKNADYLALEARYERMNTTMEAMTPAQNMYSINPNQSVSVADGLLTIGLVGLPTYENVTVNINGKQQAMAVGDTATVTVGAARCQIWVQSFDMFKATLIATCQTGQPR